MKFNYFSRIYMCICFCVFVFYFITPHSFAEDSILLRVSIAQNCKKISLYIPGKSTLKLPYTKKTIDSRNNLKTNIIPTNYGIRLAEKQYKVFGIKINTLDDKFFVNDKLYRGDILIFRDKNKKISVINYLNISDYLKGVLCAEMSCKWPIEALKAQAVAARTFAVYQYLKNKNNLYDLESNVSSQMYKGVEAEDSRSNLAIKYTKNKVLSYNKKIIPSFYHSCCGGYTEDSKVLWGLKAKYLRGRENYFCKKSPHFNWHIKLSGDKVRQIFKKYGFNLGQVKDIFVINKSKSNRVKNVFIIGENNNLILTGYFFRSIMGYQRVKSTKFDVKKIKNKYNFVGHGWGHGVGMCQWGAKNMAINGYSFDNILNYYYPGTTITNLREINIE